MKRLRITVYGRVQKVGYRDAVAELARTLGIKGTVRNLEDDVSVEIVAEGEESALKEFVKRINIKDYVVQVDKIEVREEKATGEFKHFKIIRGELTEELGERIDVAGKLLYKMLEKQDKMLEKQDKMLEKQDKMLEKQDKMLEKQDQTIGAIHEMLEKQDKMLEKQDKMLEKQDKMLEKQDQTIGAIHEMLEKQDKMLEKQDQTINAINMMHKDMTTRFDVMEQKYGAISTTLERISVALEVLAGIKPKSRS